jgi:IS30 family transposase
MKDQSVKWLTNEKCSLAIISVVGKETGKCPISAEWRYQWIWQCKHRNKSANKGYKKIYTHLKHCKRRRKRGARRDNRGIIHYRVSIERRPKIVNKRARLGDIEVDFMMGKNHNGALLVMTDRATLYTCLQKLEYRGSSIVSNAIIKRLKKFSYRIRTVTFDNDKGFASHIDAAKALNVETYFTRPYTSQDKGTVENRIGQIRRFIFQKIDLSIVTDEQVLHIEKYLNDRPVRKFNYKTPNKCYFKK